MDAGDLGGVGWQLGLVRGQGEVRRHIERQRNVLSDVAAGVVERVLGDKGAERLVRGARRLGAADRRRHLGAYLGADRR